MPLATTNRLTSWWMPPAVFGDVPCCPGEGEQEEAAINVSARGVVTTLLAESLLSQSLL
jgi:hypothetical protein